MADIFIAAQFSGSGGLRVSQLTQLMQISSIFPGFAGFDTIQGRGKLRASLIQHMALNATLSGESGLSVDTTWLQADYVWPGIVEDAGEQVLYRQAAGLEKSLADVDAYRLTQTYAELIKDQWDPYRISSTNLPYLAWAMGVNLWEDSWSEDFQRWWTANQWIPAFTPRTP